MRLILQTGLRSNQRSSVMPGDSDEVVEEKYLSPFGLQILVRTVTDPDHTKTVLPDQSGYIQSDKKILNKVLTDISGNCGRRRHRGHTSFSKNGLKRNSAFLSR